MKIMAQAARLQRQRAAFFLIGVGSGIGSGVEKSILCLGQALLKSQRRMVSVFTFAMLS